MKAAALEWVLVERGRNGKLPGDLGQCREESGVETDDLRELIVARRYRLDARELVRQPQRSERNQFPQRLEQLIIDALRARAGSAVRHAMAHRFGRCELRIFDRLAHRFHGCPVIGEGLRFLESPLIVARAHPSFPPSPPMRSTDPRASGSSISSVHSKRANLSDEAPLLSARMHGELMLSARVTQSAWWAEIGWRSQGGQKYKSPELNLQVAGLVPGVPGD